ncbi:MAG: replicative DNA helicase [Candidatus Eisenbacteria bacterium]|nr:replicative DNA helicase [Candidatus Eisenbacteria bacterium]
MPIDPNPAIRIPPQSLEAEQAVLGAMLLEKDAVGRAVEIVRPECFYRENHRRVFEAVCSCYERGISADLISVAEELRARGQIDAVGGTAFLASLLDQVATAAHVEHHARIVLEKYVMRELIHAGTEIVRRGYEGAGSSGELIDAAEQMIFAVTDPRMKRGFVPIRGLLERVIHLIEQVHENKKAVTGVPSGYVDLDKKTAGFQNSDLIIVAGRPAMGKTSFCLNIAEYAAIRERIPVGIFSLEMSRDQLVQRLLASRSRIPVYRLRTGFLSEQQWEDLISAAGILTEAPIFLDDTPAASIMEIRAKARRLKSEAGLGLLIIDYLQLARGFERSENRQQEISSISRSLKALAKELNIPVIALSQLSRAPEGREDKRPVLADLRESGAIEQDADIVVFIFREEAYRKVKQEDVQGIAEIIIGKHRNGETGTVKLHFNAELTRFESLAQIPDDGYFTE